LHIASFGMVLTAFKALAGPIYDVTFRAFVKLIELNVVPDFIIRTGVRALLQTRLDLVRLSRRPAHRVDAIEHPTDACIKHALRSLRDAASRGPRLIAAD
jgi:hypothetical protein